MTKTSIQWTDFSVNPFKFRNLETGKVGHHCTKISAGCANCYASKLNGGPYLSGLTYIAENRPKGEFFLDERVLQQVLKRKKPALIFWEDMSDMFLEDYSDEWIDRCFATMALTPHLTHQVLTKRSKRIREYMDALTPDRIDAVIADMGIEHRHEFQWPLPNVWAGVSVEDQQRADERIPDLLQTPAAVRFLSCEPLLGSITFRWPKWDDRRPHPRRIAQPPNVQRGGRVLAGSINHLDGLRMLDWVIIGGESGPGARPADLAWIRSIVRQCKAAEVECFVKQLGAHPVDGSRRVVAFCDGETVSATVELKDRKGGDIAEFPPDLRIREIPEVPRA